ncbi:uncharacterized protein BDR25DRAFT_219186 [Lindgomyces ingoldianus]|uniref:Uncharacterized protein n=1 Tax=Lindgomyces ingoldianus TaxID=673940 RepID=A0ACB6R2T3_9PLEO|nr:uncharacterized protein BDR25DRAFT_219186 [Lindgomyces ingoldianus]KAF2473456.1 hypothetical protein BDR25DRAFT_219186 [Lindgomyces ingoldianus]
MKLLRVVSRIPVRSFGTERLIWPPFTSAIANLTRPSQRFSSSCLRQSISQPKIQQCTVTQNQNLPSFFARFRRAPHRYNSTKPSPNPTPNLGSPQPAPSLSQRLRKLSREYGYASLGVYFALLVLDFPFCFLAVKSLGTERIAHWEHVVLGAAKDIIRIPFPNLFEKDGTAQAEVAAEEVRKDATEAKGDATIWTQLALAFVIHKSFIFVRVPLTAALTPKVVRTLRGWGWDIGKRKPKTPKNPKTT